MSSPEAPSDAWLEAANRMATVAVQLAAVVHETNNMLQVVSGRAELIAASAGADAALQRHANTIQAQAQRASAMLTEIVTLSRSMPEVTTVDLGEVATRALGMRKYTLTGARIAAQADVETGTHLVRVNPARLLQMALNLLINAERAVLGADRPEVIVRVAHSGGDVTLCVEDNGPGWNGVPGRLTIGEPVHAGKSPPRLGIGLYVATRLAALEGGRVTSRLRPEGGTVVCLQLPHAG